MDITPIVRAFGDEKNIRAGPRPYFNHSIELKKRFSAIERAEVLGRAGLNVFFYPAEMVTGCDLLSDSGTTTMTNEQWASLSMGDVAYGSNRGYFMLMEQVAKVFGKGYSDGLIEGKPNAFLFHQGRAAEDALFTAIGKLGKGLIIPSNGHFDTTEANIEANGIKAINLFSKELKDEESVFRFKGNMDISRFRALLEKSAKKIPVAYLTITNNTGGGNPVSMQNIREASELAHDYSIPLFIDACRFAENAWSIKKYESSYGRKTMAEIVKEMFSYADGFTISFKKDGLANMGGGLFLKNDGLFIKKYKGLPEAILNHQITTEGNPSYGGISGRDIMTIVVGLGTVLKDEYLAHRVGQVEDFGNYMHKLGLPVSMPPGSNAVYLDTNRFFEGTKMTPGGFGGISLTAILLACYGHRACELGYFAFGHYDQRKKRDVFPEVNFVRFAVPRLRYERQDLEAVAEAVKALYEERDRIPPVKVTYGRELPLRHFKARFEFNR